MEKTTSSWNDGNGFAEQYNREAKAKTIAKCNNANGYHGQQLVREKTTDELNGANGYKVKKWSRDKTVNGWKDANGYNEQSNLEGKTVSKWNKASGWKEQSNAKASSWNDANSNWEQSNRKELSAKGQTRSNPINFESLFPLTRIPQVCLLIHLFYP